MLFRSNMPAAPINDVVTLFAISNTLDAAFKWSNYYNLFGGSFSGSNDFPVRFNTATNKLWLGVVGWNSPAAEFDFPFVPNTWVHVAVSYTHRSGLLRVYRDGVRVAQVYAPSVYFPPPPPKSDPLFNEVFVLMHMDGNLNDESIWGTNYFYNTAQGNIRFSTVRRFGTQSCYFDGASSIRVSEGGGAGY